MACTSTGVNDRRLNQYAKILALDTLTAKIAKTAECYGSKELLAQADQQFGTIPVGNFEEIADLMHPHQWLTKYMEMAEVRFAYVVSRLLDSAPQAINACKDLAYEAGKENSESDFLTMKDALLYYTMNVLDGMPCDETMEILHESPVELIWRKVMDTHQAFWQQVGGNIDHYYTLLAAYVAGLFAESDIVFEEDEHETFCLSRK